ncbi:MAG: ribonuclease D [Actinomycetales bacterium]|nr:MAG: ribonuclease D [Actinomycetales bacterium]
MTRHAPGAADDTVENQGGRDPERDSEQPKEAPVVTPLTTPVDGIPEVVVDERTLISVAGVVARGTGPVAIDAERASGHRYGQRAYLVQMRRAGAGTVLLDPVACPDLRPINDGIGQAEWVLHAATQDLPCLAGVGLRPTRLFDTELGARLAGLPRVGLGAAVQHYLGLSLAKEHSAVDWSRRPLPEAWLRYAALDVEVLVELRDAVAADLHEQGKWEWAQQEFEALAHYAGPPVRIDPWRRTSGIHKIRRRRGVAVVRELWYTRDRIAQRRDIAPGRVIPDAVIVALASSPPKDAADLAGRRELRPATRNAKAWLQAIEKALALPDESLPLLTLPGNGPPPPRVWADRDPAAAARLSAARQALADFGEQHNVPVENLVTPDVVRRLLWTPPEDQSVAGFASQLRSNGAREWQIEIAAPILAAAAAGD